jgi:putative copper export protein
LTSNASAPLTVVWPLVALAGTALAVAGARVGWTAAAVGLVCDALTPLVSGRWSAVVNPVHRLAAGLWLGSLFIMVACGLTPLLRNAELGERRGALAADMVNRFSPMALSMGGVVVAFGVITAWLHLPTVASLWETPYGRTLIIKLVFVATVFGLGAFNWRRQRPTLGKESAAISIRRSATLELSVAAVVLIVTSILVSLPSPKRAPPSRPPSAMAPATGG